VQDKRIVEIEDRLDHGAVDIRDSRYLLDKVRWLTARVGELERSCTFWKKMYEDRTELCRDGTALRKEYLARLALADELAAEVEWLYECADLRDCLMEERDWWPWDGDPVINEITATVRRAADELRQALAAYRETKQETS